MSDRAGHLKLVLYLVLRRENADGESEILLQRRQNTGYMDGKYDFSASGHLKAGESIVDGICREVKEELGVVVGDVEYKLLVQDVTEGYLKCVFVADEWEGTPEIMEPDKCSELKWFRRDKLPEDEMIWYLPQVLTDIEMGRKLRIFGC